MARSAKIHPWLSRSYFKVYYSEFKMELDALWWVENTHSWAIPTIDSNINQKRKSTLLWEGHFSGLWSEPCYRQPSASAPARVIIACESPFAGPAWAHPEHEADHYRISHLDYIDIDCSIPYNKSLQYPCAHSRFPSLSLGGTGAFLSNVDSCKILRCCLSLYNDGHKSLT